MKRRPLMAVCLGWIVLLYLGFVVTKEAPFDYGRWEGAEVTITGKVYQKEHTGQNGNEQMVLYLELYDVKAAPPNILPRADRYQTVRPGADKRQNVICYLKNNQDIPEMGSIIQARGILKTFLPATNPGQFDAQSYYQILQISFQLNQTEIQSKTTSYQKQKEQLYRLRCYFSHILENRLGEEEAGLMQAILLGEKRNVDGEIKQLYQRNGIAHILSVSGLHVSLLGMTIYRLLKRLGAPKGLRVGIPLTVLVLYMGMTGFAVSSFRAVFMFSLHMVALYFGRTYDLLTAASVAALTLVAENPLYLHHSGFQLSFGCVYAIGLMLPVMTRETKRETKKQKKMSRPKEPPEGIPLRILSGAALTASCLPLQLWHFYQVPVYSVLLNLLVIPLMSFLMPGGVVLLLSGGASKGVLYLLAEGAASFLTGILYLYERSCLFAEKLPGSFFTPGRPDLWQIEVFLLCLGIIIGGKRYLTLLKKWVLLAGGILVLLFPWPKPMTITFLDVGQGDCIHIRSGSGQHFLIDGGSSDVSKVGEYRLLPYLKYVGAGRIEAVFVTHPDADHMNGILELLSLAKEQGIVIARLYLPDVCDEAKTEGYRELEAAAGKAGVPLGYLSAGQMLSSKDLSFTCLHPTQGYNSSKTNEYSMVLMLTVGRFHSLFTGDVENEGEAQMLRLLAKWEQQNEIAGAEDDNGGTKTGNGSENDKSKAEIAVLKVAHHGSAYTTSPELLSLLKPRLSVISCGKNNAYGHPHEETLMRLAASGSKILTTPQSGAVTIEVGRQVKVYEFNGK